MEDKAFYLNPNPMIMEINDEMVERLLKGDDRCKFKIGQKVVKIHSEPKDHHDTDTQGIVHGNYHADDIPGVDPFDMYLVKFEPDAMPTLIVGHKLGALSEQS